MTAGAKAGDGGGRMWVTRKEVEVLVCALGIYGCYIYYGVLHERIFKTPYGAAQEHFTFATFLIGAQCLINALAAAIPVAVWPQPRQTAPMWKYALAALFYMCAMLFSFKALAFMSYPMQALGKSSKMIPVMLMGIVVRKKRYTLREYFCVFLITAGVILFSFKRKADSGVATQPMGIVLLFASLFMDGLTGPYQESIVAHHGPSTHQLMLFQNLFAVVWVTIALLVNGEGLEAIRFLERHPAAVWDILKFGVMSALGQNFIFYTVRNISALACTTITTTRKFFTILISVILYKHPLKATQWLAVAMVFTGIIVETISKHSSGRRKLTSNKKEQ
mmetsp:Transcript_21072/g.51474  ORF Transcript_21072/g.51474 Transcript_21072/m.51474 type:complete len:334 (+) Transcript_21072:80-1081(+)